MVLKANSPHFLALPGALKSSIAALAYTLTLPHRSCVHKHSLAQDSDQMCILHAVGVLAMPFLLQLP